MAFGFFIFGAALLAAGIWADMWRRRREFYRTNAAGVQEFKDYGSAVKSKFAEGLAWMVETGCLLVGLLCAIGGFFGMFHR